MDVDIDFLGDGFRKLIEKLESWGESIIQMILNFVIALLVVGIF